MKSKPKRNKKCAPSARERHRRIIQSSIQSRTDKQKAGNNLPMAHPINKYKIELTFKPITEMLNNIINTGDIDITNSGSPIFYDKLDKCWYPLVPGLISMCDTFSKLAKEFNWSDGTAGMREFSKLIDQGCEVTKDHIQAAKATVNWMREQIKYVTPQEFNAEAIEVQIRDEFNSTTFMSPT